MLRFSFKDTPVAIKNAKAADAQAIGEEMMKATAAHAGRLDPEPLLESARNRRSALYKHIEWDDKVAAHAYRLDQVRELIRIVRVVNTDVDDVERRAFVSIHDKDGTSYRTTTEILNSVSLQLAVMAQAERDLVAWEARYADLVEICQMVRAAREKLSDTRKRQQRDQGEARPS